MATPAKRLDTNAPGDFYVDASCIDCGTCRWMAPSTFDQGGPRARVHAQPADADEALAALRALVACPTGSIGTLERHDVASVARAFPVPVAADEGAVLHCGFHHKDSFGAASYLIVRPEGNVLVDSPRFSRPLVARLERLGGVRLMVLTHRDDVAEHARFARHFGCERVLHRADVTASTRDVEHQPEGIEPVALAPDLTLIPVPGHTRGSACLLHADRFLFSGDHVAWSREGGRIHAFRNACWFDWQTQIDSMRRLAGYDFEHVLPGHGAPCRFPAVRMKRELERCIAWMEGR